MNNHQENNLTIRSTWTRQENDLFEYALTVVPEDFAGRWEQIASYIPGKTAEDVRVHYEALVHDIIAIESGRVELPRFPDDDDDEFIVNRNTELRTSQISFGGSEVRERPKKKGTPWTKEEHRKFLKGLETYGKGDWRSISRIAVVSRTPTQVASHAQKYFNRLSASPKERKRSSIHDITITTTDTTTVVQPPPTPPAICTGQGVGRGRPPVPPPTQQQQMGYGYQQNFLYPY